jgi:DNA modification methylase
VTLRLGDCLSVLPTLRDAGVACVITDPPYGVGMGVGKDRRGGSHGLAKSKYQASEDTYEEYLATVPPAIRECLRLAGRAAVFVGPHVWDLPKADVIGGVYCPAAIGRNKWGFKNLLPVLLYGKAPDLHRGAKEPTVFRSTERAKPNGHPCPKPLSWMRWLVRLTTRPGELVLDPFMGSGTTGVACALEGREFIGIERDPDYFAIAEKRIAEAEGAGTLFAGEPEPADLFTETAS